MQLVSRADYEKAVEHAYKKYKFIEKKDGKGIFKAKRNVSCSIFISRFVLVALTSLCLLVILPFLSIGDPPTRKDLIYGPIVFGLCGVIGYIIMFPFWFTVKTGMLEQLKSEYLVEEAKKKQL